MEALRRLLNALRALTTPSDQFGPRTAPAAESDPDALLGAHQHLAEAERFNGLLARPEVWDDLAPAQLARLLRAAAMGYGATEDGRRVTTLRSLYTSVLTRVPVEERSHALGLVSRDVERLHRRYPQASGWGWARALAPFIHDETDGGIVSFAAYEFARLLPLDGDDALTGPRQLVAQLKEVESDERRGWILRGLLALGDRRVLELVREARALLGADGRDVLLNYDAAEIEAGVVDFYVDWFEQAARDEQLDVASAVGETLARFASGVKGRTIVEVERHLPSPAYPSEEAVSVHGRWTVPQYAQVIAPRLLAVAESAEALPAAREVLRAWGISTQGPQRAVYH